MTQEDKDLLLKDLCARLPYDCKVTIAEGGINGLQWDNVTLNSYLLFQIEEEDGWEFVKPYLRSMSSMTEEESKEYRMFIDYSYNDFTSKSTPCVYVDKINDYLDWLNAHHFDYRGLIEKGLALEALEGMYN